MKRIIKYILFIIAGLGWLGSSATATAQSDMEHHHQHAAMMAAEQQAHPQAMPGDARMLVQFPERMRQHTLRSMRDHLLAVSEIQEALSKGWFDKAAGIAETRLGMSSLDLHGAHESAHYMPKGMQDAGLSMHKSASQFAVEAQNAAVTGDIKPALAALSRTTQACVACHAAYRLR